MPDNPLTPRLAVVSPQVRHAVDYIEANLGQPLKLADIAAAVRLGELALQLRFKRELGVTPVSFVLERRMQRVHADLGDEANAEATVAVLARRWGFVHISDFTQRYRKRFDCTPAETRRARRP